MYWWRESYEDQKDMTRKRLRVMITVYINFRTPVLIRFLWRNITWPLLVKDNMTIVSEVLRMKYPGSNIMLEATAAHICIQGNKWMINGCNNSSKMSPQKLNKDCFMWVQIAKIKAHVNPSVPRSGTKWTNQRINKCVSNMYAFFLKDFWDCGKHFFWIAISTWMFIRLLLLLLLRKLCDLNGFHSNSR